MLRISKEESIPSASKWGARVSSRPANECRTMRVISCRRPLSTPSAPARRRAVRTCDPSSRRMAANVSASPGGRRDRVAGSSIRLKSWQLQASSAAIRARCTPGSRVSRRRKKCLAPKSVLTSGSPVAARESWTSCRCSSSMSAATEPAAYAYSPRLNRLKIRAKAWAADCSPARMSARHEATARSKLILALKAKTRLCRSATGAMSA